MIDIDYKPTYVEAKRILEGKCPKFPDSLEFCDVCPMESLCRSPGPLVFDGWAEEWLEYYRDSLDGLLGLLR